MSRTTCISSLAPRGKLYFNHSFYCVESDCQLCSWKKNGLLFKCLGPDKKKKQTISHHTLLFRFLVERRSWPVHCPVNWDRELIRIFNPAADPSSDTPGFPSSFLLFFPSLLGLCSPYGECVPIPGKGNTHMNKLVIAQTWMYDCMEVSAFARCNIPSSSSRGRISVNACLLIAEYIGINCYYVPYTVPILFLKIAYHYFCRLSFVCTRNISHFNISSCHFLLLTHIPFPP